MAELELTNWSWDVRRVFEFFLPSRATVMSMNNTKKTFKLNWPEIRATAIVCAAVLGFEAWAFFM